ncbi:hypothetical protein DES40_1490 [Litorimonas taeanensis]|uniref:Flagellar protein FliL n=1 Tax=Litorimonas taeanensis TaxID=568099 RepID=A0A420WMB1_9PROT|nr:flagellar basal body-associated FliL family protein [Litorimonas taeanensis]RKQ72153.1 hypothetical protein DES40_1490 [Litorimonas taeanensis]
MIKSLVKNAVLIIAVIAGAVGASFYKTSLADKEVSSHSEAKPAKSSGHGEKKEKKDDAHGKKAKGGDSHKGADASSVNYLKFKRQFVIPVMQNKKITSLVIMNFNIELDGSASANSFAYEPKLRDAFMRDLLNLSNEGVFDNDFTSPETFEYIRETLLGSSRRIMKDGVQNVLILDIAKRDT